MRGMKSSTLSEQMPEITNYGNAEEEELNHNSFSSLRSTSIIEENLDTKKVSENDGCVGSADSLLGEINGVRQNGLQIPHPRTRSPSSLVSHVSTNNYGTNGSLLPTTNLRSPRKIMQNDSSDRLPSFVLSPRRNSATSTSTQDNQVPVGEPDVLLTDLEKTTTTNSVGSGEVSVESSKMKNGSNTSVASSLQNRLAVTSQRVATVSAGDPWREPGDGTDYEKIDSDDPVSVGTQDSSSANSFW
ncbi:hypothetical protein LSTR_LSTR002556 [Laodelphax striatellus]|uniref:Uncharacterized protein n=1 Tax=Laodelphax striatellus TaxID=195883 RepID=A0A482XLJ6_LAOST|nr:hypothetical protein LSTR_LSTR002556 [Laodelphax striatellus]